MKQLRANGKGKFTYDTKNDLFCFKVDERDYDHSIEFDEIIIDLDSKGIVTGIRIFDASEIFQVQKEVLEKISHFEFTTKVEDKVITVHLKFTSSNEKEKMIHGYDFVREASRSLQDAEVYASAT